MRVVLQRCREASCRVDNEIVGQIEHGLVALIGVGQGDDEQIVDAMATKVHQLRIFADETGRMNRNVADTGGDVLAISQFTLLADCSRGRRPAFTAAAKPELARILYQRFVERLRATGLRVPTGIFAANMQIQLVNDGPVTIVLDSPGSTP